MSVHMEGKVIKLGSLENMMPTWSVLVSGQLIYACKIKGFQLGIKTWDTFLKPKPQRYLKTQTLLKLRPIHKI